MYKTDTGLYSLDTGSSSPLLSTMPAWTAAPHQQLEQGWGRSREQRWAELQQKSRQHRVFTHRAVNLGQHGSARTIPPEGVSTQVTVYRQHTLPSPCTVLPLHPDHK